ncbi:MAG: hypothetical protein BroJett015_47660 [Chloroflexota bacterium]|nr:MAG: hypothetical protein BroJett015_47660 [Chloroflexota bacterium]
MLARLGAQLGRAQGTVVVSQAITGLGGVGKTQLAMEYIYRQQADPQTAYDLVWWLRADTVVNLAADMAALAVAVGAMSAENPDQQAALNAARRWLAQTDKRWLLLADNADDLPPRALNHYLPTGGKGHILITSRNPNWGGLVGQDAILPLDTFTRAEAIRFLQVRSRQFIAIFEGDKSPPTNREEEAEIGKLAELLGDFPLALEQAAAFMEARQMGCAAYRRLYETKRQEVWRRATPPDRYHATITTTWQMAFEQIQKRPGAVELLNLCCFLAPENIPLALFETSDFFEKSDVFTASAVSLADPLALADAVAALRRYSLVAREGESLRLHRLVQTVARDRMPPELARQWAEIAIEAIIQVLPDWTRLHEWEDGPVIVAHMVAAADLATEQGIETERLAFLCNWTGFYLKFRAEYEKARPYLERALAIHEKALGPDHPDTATSLNNLGYLLRAMGDLAAARPYLERALAIHEKALGPDHPHTATSLNNLALLLQAMGDLAAARPYLERALAIREKALGPDHPHTATSLNNLALLLRAMGDLAAARPYLERALAIHEKSLGPDHPDTASSLNNLGYLLQMMGDLAAARPYLERALAIHEKSLGPDHPDTATSLNNLALLLQMMGDLTAARLQYQRALAIHEKSLGPGHPDTATSLNNLALLLQMMGDLAAARPYLERALAIHEKSLGPGHPDTATSLNSLAILAYYEGDYPEAARLMRRALAIWEQRLGPQHPQTISARESLAVIESRLKP